MMSAIKHRAAGGALLLALATFIAGASWACGSSEKDESPQAAVQTEKTARATATAPGATATASLSTGTGLTLGPSPTAEEVGLCALAAAQRVSTWQGDMTMTMDMSLPVQTAPQGGFELTGMKVDVDYQIALDAGGHKMHALMDSKTDMPETQVGDVAATAEMYILDESMYMRMEMPGQSKSWYMQQLPAGTWQSADLIQQQMGLLKGAKMELRGTEKIEGRDCYVLEVNPTPDAFREALAASQQFAGSEQTPGTEALLSTLLEEGTGMTVRQWVSKDDCLLRKAEWRLSMKAKGLTELGLPADGELSLTMNMTMRLGSYNEPVSIELPREASS